MDEFERKIENGDSVSAQDKLNYYSSKDFVGEELSPQEQLDRNLAVQTRKIEVTSELKQDILDTWKDSTALIVNSKLAVLRELDPAAAAEIDTRFAGIRESERQRQLENDKQYLADFKELDRSKTDEYNKANPSTWESVVGWADNKIIKYNDANTVNWNEWDTNQEGVIAKADEIKNRSFLDSAALNGELVAGGLIKGVDRIINEPEQFGDYVQGVSKEIVLGKYSDTHTIAGTTGQVIAGVSGADLPGDVRDLTHDIKNWEWSWSHAADTALDAAGLIPVIGVIKYAKRADDVGGVVKYGSEGTESVIKNYDVVSYKPANTPLENHHGVLDAWAKNNIDGYISRSGDCPTIALTKPQHNDTQSVYRDWLLENTGRKVGGKVEWNNVSPREIQNLSEKMFDAADVPLKQRNEYYKQFNKYIYELEK